MKALLSLLFVAIAVHTLAAASSAQVVREYRYNAEGRLVQVTANTGVTFQYDYDANGNILLAQSGTGSAPTSFERVVPVDSSVVSARVVGFSWTRALDADNQPVSYRVTVRHAALDSSFVTSDTTASLSWTELNVQNGNTEIEWTVVASDGQLSTPARNGEGRFFVMATNVGFESNDAVMEFALHQNYPNPTAGQTTIAYELPEATHVRLGVYDLLGRRVTSVVDSIQPEGRHTATVDASSLASGQYFYRIEGGGKVLTRRLVVVR